MKPQLYPVFYALAMGTPWGPFQSLTAIEKEDGSGNCWNVTGYRPGHTSTTTTFIRIA